MKQDLALPALALAAAMAAHPVFGRDLGAPQVLIEARTVEAGPGILSADFLTNLGHVYANFPSDLAPGDRISGTLAVLPAGKKDSERSDNEAALRSLAVNACGTSFPVASGLVACPRVTESGTIEVVLRAAEKDLSNLLLEAPKVGGHLGGGSFVLPTEGIALNRSWISGPFGGDLSKTSIRIGNSDARLVAESPRSCIFDVPAEPIGRTRLRLVEPGRDPVETEFRTVGLRLTPPKRIIHSGDSTSFGAEVYGLAGLQQPLRLKLKNFSTDILAMEGGDEQSVEIAPASVSSAGTFSISRRLTGRHTGDGVINVSIPWSEESFRK
jgi:hypothetical protein